MDEPRQGWYVDPFGLHEARYFSSGTPSKLVRDGEIESFDEPPSNEWHGMLIALDGAGTPPPPSAGEPGQSAVEVIEAFIVSGRTAPRRQTSSLDSNKP